MGVTRVYGISAFGKTEADGGAAGRYSRPMSEYPFPDRQTPDAGEVFLDHVGWYVPDMDEAGAAFGRLGFVLTPYTLHAHENAAGERIPSGTANRCAMLRRGYLEILTHVPELETALAGQLRAGLDRYTGLHLIAFTCADAEIEAARLAGAGFDPLPVARLRRPVRAGDGSEAVTEFSVIRLKPGAMAEGRIQMLTQDTPDTVWQEQLIARDNAIDALVGVIVCTADPDGAASRFGRFTAHGPEAGRIALDRGGIEFFTPERWRELAPGASIPSDPFIAAAVLRSRDLVATCAFLEGRGVAVTEFGDGSVLVDASDAMGAHLVIHGLDGAPLAC